MIPTKPPPKFNSPENWSDKFNKFIARCLIKNPNDRPSAEDLLKDPFITSAPGLVVLSELVGDAMDLIAEGALARDEVILCNLIYPKINK